jgi:hypothetical protein
MLFAANKVYRLVVTDLGNLFACDCDNDVTLFNACRFGSAFLIYVDDCDNVILVPRDKNAYSLVSSAHFGIVACVLLAASVDGIFVSDREDIAFYNSIGDGYAVTRVNFFVEFFEIDIRRSFCRDLGVFKLFDVVIHIYALNLAKLRFIKIGKPVFIEIARGVICGYRNTG